MTFAQFDFLSCLRNYLNYPLIVFEGDGHIKDYPGSYSQYREWKAKQEVPENKESKNTSKKPKQKAEKTVGSKKRKLSFNEKREFEQLEKDIDELEERKGGIQAELNLGGSDFCLLYTSDAADD